MPRDGALLTLGIRMRLDLVRSRGVGRFGQIAVGVLN
jgi:hypothetical protein